MADRFQGSDHVELRTGAESVPIWLKFNAATASTKNDGSIPYGSTVYSATVTMTNSETGAATTELHTAVSESSNRVIVYLQHSTAVSTGLYYLQAEVTFSLSGTTQRMTRPFDLDRILVTD